jgi:hypothetical protein
MAERTTRRLLQEGFEDIHGRMNHGFLASEHRHTNPFVRIQSNRVSPKFPLLAYCQPDTRQ